MPDIPPFAPEPPQGRVFEGSRRVRATDATAAGRLRLDGLTRYLQDVAEDDVAGTGWQPPYGWLLRRCEVTVRVYPRVTDRVTLRTFCSGTGPRWAQRTTTVLGGGGAVIQAVALWVAVDPATGQPCPLGEDFYRFYGESAQRHRASARLELPGPDGSAPARGWPTRAADFDTAGHVNNTVYWAALEDVIRESWADPPRRAVVEYHRPILPGDQPFLRASVVSPSPDGPGRTDAWLTDAGGDIRYASARLTAA
ncbi:MAG TPA: acyl-ACP thioesterase domain-containing protein [Trebonia sp.]|nr:acyl-ACP thioesterase domain-containing protein [Trebonia sp.]